jgi:hypothetical protein
MNNKKQPADAWWDQTNLNPCLPLCRLKNLFLGLGALAFFGMISDRAAAQGCIAVRGAGVAPPHAFDSATPDNANLDAGNWLGTISDRYLHSSRHFVGDREQYQRQLAGNQVINHQDFIDLDIQYAVTPRWSVGLLLPFEFSDRSQLAPGSLGGVRYHTQSAGMGDMRLAGYAWLWDPKQNPKGNIQLGLGLKVPTGQDDVSDTFLTATGPVVHPVDQSIQPGDGGWGFTVELNAYREIFPRTEIFAQGLYLFNPEDTNGVLTWRDNSSTTPGAVTATPKSASYYEHFMSIPDQYFARGGLSYTLVPQWGLSLSVAGRVEGVPPRDLIGASDGFRRPGFIVSIEPGLEIMKGRYSFDFSLPYALYRNRQTSVADSLASAASGTSVHGDAAFADYVITASFSVRF